MGPLPGDDAGVARTPRKKSLYDVYRFRGFVPGREVKARFGDRTALVIRLTGRSPKRRAAPAAPAAPVRRGWYDRRTRHVRDLSRGDRRVYLEVDLRRVDCRVCGAVKRERLAWLLDSPFCTTRFGAVIGAQCRTQTIHDVAREHLLEAHGKPNESGGRGGAWAGRQS